MEAGIAVHVWTLEDAALLLEGKNMETRHAKRGPRGLNRKKLSA